MKLGYRALTRPAAGALGDEGNAGGSFSRLGSIVGGSTGLGGNTTAGGTGGGGTGVGMAEIPLVLAGDGDAEVRSIDPRFEDCRGVRSRDGVAKDGPSGLRSDILTGAGGGPFRVGIAGTLVTRGSEGLVEMN